MKVRMDGVEGKMDTELMDIKELRPHAHFDLEFRDLEMNGDENNGFELWNKHTVFLKAVKYDPTVDFDFDRGLDKIPTKIVAFNMRTTKVSDMEKELAQEFDIPEDKLVVVLRHEKFDGSVSPEYFNMEWRRSKRLMECSKFEHGGFVFVEETDVKLVKFADFKWPVYWKLEKDRLTLKINDPEKDPEGDWFNIDIPSNRLTTLGEFK